MNIVIVGGGTAGWLAALMINKVHPLHKVTVIESSTIGIVGAGEGSTGLLTSIIRGDMFDFGCNLYEFMKETGASIKYGIMHKDWHTVGEKYFAPLAGSPTSGGILDSTFCVQAETMSDKMHLLNKTGIMMEHNASPFNSITQNFADVGHALHFDAHDVGRYFKKVVLKNDNVTHIDDEITEVKLSENGHISSLVMKSGKVVKGDFFIDASGFARVLVKRLEVPWVSYKNNLPVNSAMPFLLDYEEDEVSEPWTTAWAQSSGWMWQIPTMKRKGCGYVFCDDFITADQAQAEIETTLNRKITPIRILKFDTGRLNKAWTKNCLAIGLCSAFAEPLEATSIHSTIVQLLNFVFEYLKPTKELTVNTGSSNIYNKRTAQMYDDFKDFLNVHYMGGRTDSEFWKFIKTGATQTEFTRNILEMSKTKMPSNKDFNQYLGSTDWGLWSYIMFGTKNLSTSVMSQELDAVKEKINGMAIRDYGSVLLNQYKSEHLKIAKSTMSYDKFIEFMRK